MSVFGICMVKDEADVIGYTLPAMAEQLHHVLLADNNSTDETRDIVEKVAADCGNITILDDAEPAYLQSQKMTALALTAADAGARWVVPFDADEVWRSESGPLWQVLRDAEPDVLRADLYDHVVTGADDESDPNPLTRIGYRRVAPAVLPKVACRIRPGLVIEQGNHGVRYPGYVRREASDITIHHFPYRSAEQMARKARNGAAAYAAAGERLAATDGQHWRDYGRFYEQGGIAAIADIFFTWFFSADPTTDPTLVYDPA